MNVAAPLECWLVDVVQERLIPRVEAPHDWIAQSVLGHIREEGDELTFPVILIVDGEENMPKPAEYHEVMWRAKGKFEEGRVIELWLDVVIVDEVEQTPWIPLRPENLQIFELLLLTVWLQRLRI